MDISLMDFLLLVLASFRITRLLVYDRITEFIRSLVLEEVTEKNEMGEDTVYYVPRSGRVRGFFGELISCYWCTGVWSAIFLILLYYLFPSIYAPFVLVFAIAGAAAFIEVILQKLMMTE
ncbi:DUF1360 domain-containing protein [Niallia sp. NCCP-28]|uniref:DUF1360 domain-containing protein n=1 Tax=Niallia sp. NCCP-28 TaxID=2934712 RepID=UPI0020828C4C|nr:DUF1360 domain-containing protein [Niallia sp. NCCP-28]GKU81820.1 membrane protein [Niallia sp. NCCP-28]